MANEVITIENLSEFKTKYDQKLSTSLSGKQDTISDLASIRSGASAGATAVQPDAISDMATESWVQDQGYLTEHQSLEGLMAEDKLTIENGKITKYDGTPFAGQGGGESDIVVFNDSNLPTSTELDEAIAANKAICVVYEGRNYMFDRQSSTTYYFYGADAYSSYLYALTYNGTKWSRTQQVLAKQSWVNSQGFAKASDIPSLEGYATEQWVSSQGYAHSSDIPTNVSQLNNDAGYLTEHQSLEGLMDERKLTIEDGKITEYDGTPFAGQGGGGEGGITASVNGYEVDSLEIITDNRPEQYGDATNPLINGEELRIYKAYYAENADNANYADHANNADYAINASYDDAGNNIIDTYATITQVEDKQDRLTDVTDIQLVSSLPDSPDATVLYLIPED